MTSKQLARQEIAYCAWLEGMESCHTLMRDRKVEEWYDAAKFKSWEGGTGVESGCEEERTDWGESSSLCVWHVEQLGVEEGQQDDATGPLACA